MMKKVPKNSKSNKNKKKKKGGRTSPKGSVSPVKKGLSPWLRRGFSKRKPKKSGFK